MSTAVNVVLILAIYPSDTEEFFHNGIVMPDMTLEQLIRKHTNSLQESLKLLSGSDLMMQKNAHFQELEGVVSLVLAKSWGTGMSDLNTNRKLLKRLDSLPGGEGVSVTSQQSLQVATALAMFLGEVKDGLKNVRSMPWYIPNRYKENLASILSERIDDIHRCLEVYATESAMRESSSFDRMQGLSQGGSRRNSVASAGPSDYVDVDSEAGRPSEPPSAESTIVVEISPDDSSNKESTDNKPSNSSGMSP